MAQYAASHIDTQGPGDARPTALQVVEDEGLVGKFAGKVVLITGANSGIGLETARAIHATGATLYLTARDSAKAQEAIKNIKNGSGPKSDAPIHPLELRLESLASVRAAAKSFLDKGDALNLLILNAGVMATPEGRTEDGFETQFGINHLGHFLLFQLLKPVLLASSTPDYQSRLIVVASSAHTYGGVRLHDFNFEKEPYNSWAAYGQSKTANILFANEAERRYGAQGLHALSLHPGFILQTGLSRHLSEEEATSVAANEAWVKASKTAAQGAATTVYAALSREWEGRGGKYLSNLVETTPADPSTAGVPNEPHYFPWAYDSETEEKLWEASCKLVGVSND